VERECEASDLIDSLKQELKELPFGGSHEARSALFYKLIAKNRISEAGDLAAVSIEKSLEAEDQTGAAQYRIYLSVTQRFQLNYDSAYQVLFTVLEQIHDIDHSDSILSQVYNLFGVYLFDRGQTTDAYLYFKKAAVLCEKYEVATNLLVHIYNNLAVISLNIGEDSTGLVYCNKAADLNWDGNESLRFKINHNKVLVFLSLSNCDSALHYYNLADKQLRGMVDKGQIILALSDYLGVLDVCYTEVALDEVYKR
jgi:tetratricopeptide (TPR) repeat protein